MAEREKYLNPEEERIDVQSLEYGNHLHSQVNQLLTLYQTELTGDPEEARHRDMQIPFLLAADHHRNTIGRIIATHNQEITMRQIASLWRSTIYAYQYVGLQNNLQLPAFGSDVQPLHNAFETIFSTEKYAADYGKNILRYPSVSKIHRYSPIPVLFANSQYRRLDIGAAAHIGDAGQESPKGQKETHRLMELAGIEGDPGSPTTCLGLDLQPVDDNWVRACSYYVGHPEDIGRANAINASIRNRDADPKRFIRRQGNIFHPWTRLPLMHQFDVASTFFVTHMNYTFDKWKRVMAQTLREGGSWLHLGTETMVTTHDPDSKLTRAKYPLTVHIKYKGRLEELGPACWFGDDQEKVTHFEPAVVQELQRFTRKNRG